MCPFSLPPGCKTSQTTRISRWGHPATPLKGSTSLNMLSKILCTPTSRMLH